MIGGGILVAWHPNAIVDALIITNVFPYQVIFGGRHGLFRYPLLGRVMKARMRLAGLIPEVHPRWHSSADNAGPGGSRRHPQETPNPEELKRQAKD